MKFGSLFSGIEGFGIGFERAGLECVWQCEINKQCNSVRRRYWPNVPQFEDVRKLHAKDVIRPDIICGGFPCQDLSVAGRRAGLAGERSGLFHEFARLLAEIRPGWVCIENVPGLLSSNGGRDMGIVVGTLADIGYRWAYRVLDAQHFGLAQRRKRVFIVGSLGNGLHPAEILFDSESLSRNPPTRGEAGAGTSEATAYRTSGNCGVMPQGNRTAALNTATNPTQNIVATLNSGGNNGGFRAEPGEHLVAGTLMEKDGRGVHSDMLNFVAHPLLSKGNCSHAEDLETYVAHQCHGSNVGPMGTLRSGNGDVSSGVPFVAFDTTQCTSGGNYSNPQPGGPCHPLASRAHAPAIAGTGVRRLTPRECERLQGFPDDFTRWDADGKEVSDSARYRMLGNAVAVPVAEWIARRILEISTKFFPSAIDDLPTVR